MDTPFITICIATFNRGKLLRRALESIITQDFENWEIVLVDDGSEDETPSVAEEFTIRMQGRLRYFRQSNKGRPHALNYGIREARGELFVILDDDDIFVSGAFKRIHEIWSNIPLERRNTNICGIVGLCDDFAGNLIGDTFSDTPRYENYFHVRFTENVRGDKKEVVQTKLIKDFQFEPEAGDRRVPTSLLWFMLATKYKMYISNDVLVVKDYQPDGMTNKIFAIRKASARTMEKYYASLLKMFPQAPFRVRLALLTNAIRFSIHGGSKYKYLCINRITVSCIAIPFAILFYMDDVIRKKHTL